MQEEFRQCPKCQGRKEVVELTQANLHAVTGVPAPPAITCDCCNGTGIIREFTK